MRTIVDDIARGIVRRIEYFFSNDMLLNKIALQ